MLVAANVAIWKRRPSLKPCGNRSRGGSNAATGTYGRMAFVNRQGAVNHIFLMDVNAAGVGVNVARLTGDTEAARLAFADTDGVPPGIPVGAGKADLETGAVSSVEPLK